MKPTVRPRFPSTHWLVLLAAALLLFAGCDWFKSKSTPVPTPKPPPTPTEAEQKVQELTRELQAKNVALQTKIQEVNQLKADRSDPKLPPANADLIDQLGDLLKRIKALEKAASQTVNPLPPAKGSDTSSDTVSPPPPPTPTATGGGQNQNGNAGQQNNASPGQSTGDDAEQARNEAVKSVLKALGAAVCVSNPELCPFVAILGDLFDLFPSSDERDKFLEATTRLAEGTPLTNDDVQTLTGALKNNFGKLPPGAVHLFQQFSQLPNGAEVGTLLNQQLADDLNKYPQMTPLIGLIKQGIQKHTAAADIARDVVLNLQGSRFPSLASKLSTLRAAESAGADAATLEELKKIPSPSH